MTIQPRHTAGRKWNAQKIQKLCTLWEEETHLYDAKHPLYKDPVQKENSYERMAALVDMDGRYRLGVALNFYL